MFKNLFKNIGGTLQNAKSAIQRALTFPKKQRDGIDKTLHLAPGTTEVVGDALAGAAANAATNELTQLAEQEAGKL